MTVKIISCRYYYVFLCINWGPVNGVKVHIAFSCGIAVIPVHAYQICAGFEQGLYDELCGKLAEEAGVTSVVKEIPDGVEVTTREKNGIRYVFVQNFNRNAVEIKLPVEQYPVWNGQYDGTIGSWETVVLKENSPNFREK